MKHILCLAILAVVALAPTGARAACADPVGAAGDVIWTNPDNVPAYCNDTDWIAFPKGTGSGFAPSVGAGGTTTCVTSSGFLYCFGNHNGGITGLGLTSGTQTTPAQVGTDTNWRSVSVGNGHSCGIESGALYCWGTATYGQTGLGVASQVDTAPVQAGTDTGWFKVSAGDTHTCGIESGELYCWGLNGWGQTGFGISTGEVHVPTQVGTDADWSEVSASFTRSSCGIRAGRLYCWGNNANARTGLNTTTGDTLVPTQLGSATGWSNVRVGNAYACGIESGALYCWGNNANARTGLNTTAGNTLVPTQVGSDTDWITADTGDTHGCGIRGSGDAGTLWCWGNNTFGATGQGTTTGETLVPSQVGTDADWTLVDSGSAHTCGYRGLALYCWGAEGSGRTGHGVVAGNLTTPGVTQMQKSPTVAFNNPSPNGSDFFGQSVAMSGNLVVVGAYSDESDGGAGVGGAGRAYVYNATTGALVTALDNPSPNAVDWFGNSVGISGNLAVVGANQDESDGGAGVLNAGRAYVFNATTGALVATLNNPSPNSGDSFGGAVAISGNLAVVGVRFDESDGGAGINNAGRAYVFNATTGALVATLDNPSPNDSDAFGVSVGISGNLVVVGAHNDESDGGAGTASAGRAYVFNATTGVLVSTLNNPSPNVSDLFGSSVGISGDLVVVSAENDESDGGTGVSAAGRAYVYNATTGVLVATLNNPSPNSSDNMGVSIAIDGNLVVAGAHNDESDGASGTSAAGRAYLFDATTGGQIAALNNPSPNTNDYLGRSVAVSGNLILVGAESDESDGGAGVADAGRAYLYRWTGGCSTPDGVTGDILYNSSAHVLQFCDGDGWHAAAPAGDGGAGCATPAAAEGALIYNSTDGVLQYCEGDTWRGIGKD